MWDGNYLYLPPPFLPPSQSGYLITEHRQAVRPGMIWCCVLSLHDENQCRNVCRRMLGSDTTIRFFCLFYIFVSSMWGPERFRGWFLFTPTLHLSHHYQWIYIKLWKTSFIRGFAPDFLCDINVRKIGQFPGHHFVFQTVFPALHGWVFIPDLRLIRSLAEVAALTTPSWLSVWQSVLLLL